MERHRGIIFLTWFLQCCMWTWYQDQATICYWRGRIWGSPSEYKMFWNYFLPSNPTFGASRPSHSVKITTRLKVATARVTAATTTRTRMQSSRLKKLSYPSSPLVFSEYKAESFPIRARFEIQLLLLLWGNSNTLSTQVCSTILTAVLYLFLYFTFSKPFVKIWFVE